MLLRYRRIDHVIQFANPLSFPTLPSFVFRSILGKELKRLTCIFRGRPCADCGLKYTCAYSWIFESPLETQPEVLEGRDRGSHPFLLATDAQPRQQVQTITLTLTVMGKAIEYYPYLYYALKRAGEIGILRERVPFEITEIRCEGQEIIAKGDSIDPKAGIKEWELNPTDLLKGLSGPAGQPPDRTMRVFLQTPLRLRVDGKYSSQFTAEHFLTAVYRRARILCSLYGKTEIESSGQDNVESLRFTPLSADGMRIITRDIRWVDLPYFSSRQKRLLKLGGIVGSFTLRGHITNAESSILRFGELFHAGKNTAFGLGKFRVEEISG